MKKLLEDIFSAVLKTEANEQIGAAPTLEESRKRRDTLLDFLTTNAPKAARVLEAGFDDMTIVYVLPIQYRKKLRTSNSVERLNEELRRRQRVLRIFPTNRV